MNTDVRRIQSALDRQSFKVNITGTWDAATCQALLAFQTAKYGAVKRGYLDSETFMDLGLDAKTADRLEASYGHVCGGVEVPPSTYGNTVGKSMTPEVKRIQRALGVRETGKLDERTCAALGTLARNSGQSALLTRPVLERLGFTSTEAAAIVQKFAFATCGVQATARGRATIAGVGLDYPGFSGFDVDGYDECNPDGQCDQNPNDWEDTGLRFDVCEDPADKAAVWASVLPAGHHWCTATPSSLRVVGDWVLVDQSCNGIKRKQYSDNVGAAYYQFWRTLTNEERWACPKSTALTSRKKQLIKLMQGVLLDLGYDLGSTGADGSVGKFTCRAAYTEQGKAGICGEELLTKKLFQRLAFSAKEVEEAWTEISGVCRGEYTSAFACGGVAPVTPVEPPIAPPAAKDCDPSLPPGMAWCSGQPAGATRVSGPSPVPNCAGWTKEMWKTTDTALHAHFIQSAKKLSKWACATKRPSPDPVPPPPVDPVKKAGWGWIVGGLLVAAAAGTFYFSKPAGSSKRRR
jgi:hypothetical protein